MSQQCPKCDKRVYPTEKIELSGKWFHKSCFKCSESGCTFTISLKNFQMHDGNIYCFKHVPKHQAAQMADDVSLVHAMSKASLHCRSSPSRHSSSYCFQLDAPKREAEGLHKNKVGVDEHINLGADALETKAALNAPRRQAENLGYIQKGARP